MSQAKHIDHIKSIKIGVDATIWNNKRGYGRHARALLSDLVRLDTHNHYTFILDSDEDLALFPEGVEIQLVRVGAPTTLAAASNSNRSLTDMWRMSKNLSDANFELLLFPTIYSYVPSWSRAKKIVMIHDLIPEKYPELTLPGRRERLFWRLKSALGRWQADAIVTVSDYSKQCITKYFNISPERIFVVGEASDQIFRIIEHPKVPAKLVSMGISSKNRLIAYVGGFGPHKNLESMIDVFAKVINKPGYVDVCLVMVGEYEKEVFHSQYKELKAKIDTLGIEKRVIFTAYLSDDDLVSLLNISTVLVLPSLMEGFGLPAVEAASCGCPVIATKESPLPELLGDGGLYIDPKEPVELENALRSVLDSQDVRCRMRQAGLLATRALTWAAAAKQMIEVINRVAKS